jgi:hypothetical protein
MMMEMRLRAPHGARVSRANFLLISGSTVRVRDHPPNKINSLLELPDSRRFKPA